MNFPAAPQIFHRVEQGFDVYGLQNDFLSVALVPELGAKVVSLLNRRTGKEWMWVPPGGFKLFGNRTGDDFANSTMIGWDECLPTIAPCLFQGRALPDHGEVWSVPWTIDPAAFQRGELKTAVRLPVSPLDFERTISLSRNAIWADYRLINRNDRPEAFLWALHALLPVPENGMIEASREAAASVGNPAWLDSLNLDGEEPKCSKRFAGPLSEGRACVRDRSSGDALHYAWDAASNPWLGLWLTRGGWNGYHHLALEPANGASDSLAEAAMENRSCGVIPALETVAWRVTISASPAA